MGNGRKKKRTTGGEVDGDDGNVQRYQRQKPYFIIQPCEAITCTNWSTIEAMQIASCSVLMSNACKQAVDNTSFGAAWSDE
jgi:hypothetical protein